MTDSNLTVRPDYVNAKRPHVAEWFGHRVFPIVSGSEAALQDQLAHRCPFLTTALGSSQRCVKSDEHDPAKRNSAGVCTISSTSNKIRQDWLVCPFRALDERLMQQMVRRLFSVASGSQILVRPAPVLEDPQDRAEVLQAIASGDRRAFVYFQGKLGGEIGLPKTAGSPAMSFDVTVVEILAGDQQQLAITDSNAESVSLGKYGVIELQTTDTHGSYKETVKALTDALNLHPADFHRQLANNPEWAGKKVEGPNVSNVFKRTFYQVAFKFQATKRESSVGCILVLPKPVWDSWQPFLGAPELTEHEDGTFRLLDDNSTDPSDWIYVFDVAEKSDRGGPAQLAVGVVLGTNAAALSRAALDIAPKKAVEGQGSNDAVLTSLRRRLKNTLPGLGL
ncbi:PDDEXK family nuclease [Streptacidiphilus sp. PAMC 29251]